MIERVFHISENHTKVRTELLAGLTTLMAMACMVVVNPRDVRGGICGGGDGVHTGTHL